MQQSFDIVCVVKKCCEVWTLVDQGMYGCVCQECELLTNLSQICFFTYLESSLKMLAEWQDSVGPNQTTTLDSEAVWSWSTQFAQ